MSNLLAINGNIIGGLPIASENLKLLWENSDPTSAFAAQTISLSTGDYDFLLWIYGAGSASQPMSQITVKGVNASLNGALTNSTTGTTNIYRSSVYVSDTSFSVGDGSIGRPGSASSTDNTVCKPLAVYGIYKKSIANTEASKCMLSDGVTSVNDAIDGLTWKYLDSTTGDAEITISADATEVYARATQTSTSASFHFLTVEDNISVDRASGYYAAASNYFSATFMWTKSTRKAKLYAFSFAGTDYTNNTTTKWYYKTR